jgi:hypothetical protein
LCDDAFTEVDAQVACRELGHQGGGQVIGASSFGVAPSTTWLDEVACVGSEIRLQDCPAVLALQCIGELVGIECSTGDDTATAITATAIVQEESSSGELPIAARAAVGGILSGACVLLLVLRWYCRKRAPASAVTPLAAPPDADEASASASIDEPGTPVEVVEQGCKGQLSVEAMDYVPQYWFNSGVADHFDQMLYVSPEHHKAFDDLLTTSYVPRATRDRPCPNKTCARTAGGCPCVQPDGIPGLPKGYRVRRVIRVEESRMIEKYGKQRDRIRKMRTGEKIKRIDPPAVTNTVAGSHPEVFVPLDNELNEVYLWHGTSVRAALSIAQNDFRIDLAGSNSGTMYGRGAYCAESSTKADEYGSDEVGGYYQGLYAVLLCRVCMGKMYYTTTRNEQAGDRVKEGDYDSTLGDRAKMTGTFREFVIYNQDQIYPEYVVLYSRIMRNDDVKQLERAAQAIPFQMELPIYWANCHRSPQQASFQIHYRVA